MPVAKKKSKKSLPNQQLPEVAEAPWVQYARTEVEKNNAGNICNLLGSETEKEVWK